MKERIKKHWLKVAFPAFYLACFLTFVSWTFPFDRVKERIVVAFNAQQTKGTSGAPQQLSIDELTSYWVSGVRARGVRIKGPPAKVGEPAPELLIDEARARVSILPLLIGHKNVKFGLDAFDGTVKGTFEDQGGVRRVEVEVENVDVGKISILSEQLGFPLAGRLTGKLALDLPEGKASKAGGTLHFEIQELAAGTAKELSLKTPMGPFTLPRLNVGTLVIDGTAANGVLKLTKVGASGKDIELDGDGRVQLRELATDAQLDVAVKLKINDAYRGKNEKTTTLFGKPGGGGPPAIIELDPKMSRAKTSDGFYAFRVRGTLAKPDFAPGSGAGNVPGLSTSPPPGAP